MKTLARWTEGKVSLITVIFLFWALFWVLNGADKFFNGEYVPNLENWSTKGVLVDSKGDVTHTLHSMETVGPFGVNRDAQMAGFFQRIHLPGEMALVSLYGIAVLELVLGLAFLVLLAWSFLPEAAKVKTELLADRTFHHLAFKGSMMIFVLFIIGDNLFGERMELWEHSTFLLLCLVTYMLWQRADNYVKTKGSALVRESASEVKSDRVRVRSGGQLVLRRKISTRLQTLGSAETGNTGQESPVVH
jgi:hypothetical protein